MAGGGRELVLEADHHSEVSHPEQPWRHQKPGVYILSMAGGGRKFMLNRGRPSLRGTSSWTASMAGGGWELVLEADHHSRVKSS